MRVLLWVSPVTEMSWPFKRLVWLKSFVPHVLSALRYCANNLDITTIVSSDLMVRARAEGVVVKGRIIEMSQYEATNGHCFDELSVTKAYHRGECNIQVYSHFTRILKNRLGADYTPDVVIVLGHAPFLRAVYPTAKIFFHEYSLFSRSPYPTTFAFDPFGQAYGFTLSKQAAFIESIPATKDEIHALKEYRRQILEVFRSNAAVSAYFEKLHKTFSRILLLPLGCDNTADTLVTQNFKTHFELVERVLESVDADTCVCVTQHPTAPAIPQQRMRELRQVHPNLRSEDWFVSIPRFSQVALAYCDACAYDYTSIAYQAAFLGVPTVSLGGFCAGIADILGFDRIQEVFACQPRARDNFVIWALKHYACTTEDMPLQIEAYLKSNFDRDEPGEKAVSLWPEILSSAKLIERLPCWFEQNARPFAKELAKIDVEANSTSVADQLKEAMRSKLEIAQRLKEREKEITEITERMSVVEKRHGELWKTFQESQSVRSQVWSKFLSAQAGHDKVSEALRKSQSIRQLIWNRLQESQAVRHKIWKRLQSSESIRKLIWSRFQCTEASCIELLDDLDAVWAEIGQECGECESASGHVCDLDDKCKKSSSESSVIAGRLSKAKADLEHIKLMCVGLLTERRQAKTRIQSLESEMSRVKSDAQMAIEAEREVLAGVRGELANVATRRDALQAEMTNTAVSLAESIENLKVATRKNRETEQALHKVQQELQQMKAVCHKMEQSWGFRFGRFLSASVRWVCPKRREGV